MASTVIDEARASSCGRHVRLRTRETGAAAWRNLRPLAVVTGPQMARIDDRAQGDWSLPGAVLMENAGANGYAAVRAHLWGGASARGPLVFVAGRGNNGGDAFVMARHAHVAGADEVVVALAGGEPRGGGATAANLAACRALQIPIVAGGAARAALQRAAWIFDGITGTGLRSSLAPPLAAVVEQINAASGSVVAIDVPSGLRDGYAGGPLVRAAATVTMGLPKRCLYLPRVRTAVGEILVVAVGFPPALLTDPAIGCHLLTGDLLPRLLPAAAPDAHKGTRGHVAVFAGAPGTTGAAHLAGGAAARSGAGLVTLYADRETYALLAPAARSTMCRPLAATGRRRPGGTAGPSPGAAGGAGLGAECRAPRAADGTAGRSGARRAGRRRTYPAGATRRTGRTAARPWRALGADPASGRDGAAPRPADGDGAGRPRRRGPRGGRALARYGRSQRARQLRGDR